MVTRMQQRRGSAAVWQDANTLLSEGEIGYETDTNKFKVGDGVTTWNSLPYFVNSDDIQSGLLDTDNVSEGTLNLYFTDQRAIDAVGENLALDDLSDVATSGVSDGDALVFDTATSSWIPGQAGTTINSINDIADVDTSAKQDGYVLTYNGTSSEWEAAAPTGGSGGTADDNAIFKATLFFGGK
jgi:hypothetical protein